jgi:5'-3' exonuclease
MTRSLYLIDGLNQVFRAYYAPFRELTSGSGEPTKAVFVFLRMLIQLVREREPHYLALVMEGPGPDFRREAYPAYKAHRKEMPDDLRSQVGRIQDIVAALGIPVLRAPGFEADDMMATVVRAVMDEPGLEVVMVSSDKDLRQLLRGDAVCLYDPRKGLMLDAFGLEDEHGYTPSQSLEIQTLAGDSTDNVPGVCGVGEKTAVKLILKYGSAAEVVAHADELTPKQRQNVLDFAQQMPLTRRLVTLRDDAPSDFRLHRCELDIDVSAAAPLLEELGLHGIVEALRGLIDRPRLP